MDDWIAEVVLGQEPRANGGGALAAASKERQSVRLDLVQADSDLLSETLNSTLIAWICEYNGLAPCLVYRQIKEEEDKKAESETDKNVAGMGFELSEEAVREKYGDGWRKKAVGEPSTEPLANPQKTSRSLIDPASANFAEAPQATAGDAIDKLIDAESEEWEPVLDPMLAVPRRRSTRPRKTAKQRGTDRPPARSARKDGQFCTRRTPGAPVFYRAARRPCRYRPRPRPCLRVPPRPSLGCSA
jgi:phage gp29-like protein